MTGPTPFMDDLFAGSVSAFESLLHTLQGKPAQSWTHAELEEHMEEAGRQLLRQLLQDHLDLRARREEEAARREVQPRVIGPDGRLRPWRETDHARSLACMFGLVRVKRIAYRGPLMANVHPADATLSLPAGRHSMGLRRLAVIEAVRGSFDQAQSAIERRCGRVLGKRRLEQLVAAASGDIDSFYQQHIPVPCSRDVLLVIEVDGKGVVMRPEALRPATQRARLAAEAGHRSRITPGEKPNRKRMATVACVFDALPAPRRPHDVIHPPGGRSTRRRIRRGPAAARKWCTASLLHPPEKVIADVFSQAEARDPGHHRCWVVLVDGARHQLDLIQREAARRGCTINVLLDFVHVTEYVWTAVRREAPCCIPNAVGRNLEKHSWVTRLTGTRKRTRDQSMPGKQCPSGGVQGGVLQDPRDMAKAELLQVQSPAGVTDRPSERRLKPTLRSARTCSCCPSSLQSAERHPMRVGQGDEWTACLALDTYSKDVPRDRLRGASPMATECP
ncbi:hypothetical protein H9Y04_45340 [Streptomyces sp. TRM66268-LWL]|uniref:ISKra4 family transposase n=1 Tax=Streptomyces polyasparticus TaxID=2767826 RepID=A0ABR7SW42_9ACTN|nr:hypothetical protein [Streptomyces polyasparticus]